MPSEMPWGSLTGKRTVDKRIGVRGMIEWKVSKIGTQLLIIILSVIVLSMGSLMYLATNLVAEFGEYSATINENNLMAKSHLFLSRITYEEAMKLRPPGNDDAILRWNNCVRTIERNHEICPPPDEPREQMLE